MINAILASTVLLATTVYAAGSAVVVNSCSYPVALANTPSAGGGYSEIDQTLAPGASYSQQYTELSNGNGWSLKLYKPGDSSNILQYEYTFHNDGIIWYDLSEVNGNPWDGNWEITATAGCSPRQAAYRYSTDDAYGMQSCADDATITVTLCSGDAGGAAPAGSSSASSSVATSAASTWTSTAAATTPVASPTSTATHAYGPPGEKVAKKEKTTLLTKATSVYTGPATTITNVMTVHTTVFATESPAAKRHEHHARHPHAR